MATVAMELELPIADGPGTPLALQRLAHLRGVGVSEGELVRLVRGFRSLRAVYTASHEELARLVGPETAARIRWFLDAPLDTHLAVEPAAAAPSRPLRLLPAA